MKVLYYDCFCGISGDMNLAALINLGVPKEYLIKELEKLNLSSEYEIKVETAMKLGITGTRVDVILKNAMSDKEHINEEVLKHHGGNIEAHVHDSGNHKEHKHVHIHYGAKHVHWQEEKHHHDHRNLNDIEKIINSSDFNDRVKSLSLNIFMKVAEAEAKVHGKDLYEVHFHEVGAIDSIVDIVGAAIALDYLNVDKIIASSVQVGGGFVKCAHGLMPVPTPATVEILRNVPINTGIVEFETTTPTGAAILAANVAEYTDKIDFSIDKIGYGIGHRDLEIPNVLRVYLGTIVKSEEKEEQYIIETNIDDMNPEVYGYLEENLFENEALDVYKTPIIMKKGRPAVKLSVLVNEQNVNNILELIFKESTSIGVRKYKVEKIMLDREFSKVRTSYGEITVKYSYYKGEMVKYKPEYEECKKVAKEKNIPIEVIYKEIYRVVEESCK